MRPQSKFKDTHVSLAHGNGGRLMRELIDEVFASVLKNPFLDTTTDAVCLPTPIGEELVVTTDGFTVKPIEFPGGNIGSLAVHGTVNDLAVVGAVPRFMTLSVFVEEGLDIAVLRRVVDSLAQAAHACGVSVVAGDTKVVGRGECDGIYLSATGIGFKSSQHRFAVDQIHVGDHILVSGPVGEHGGDARSRSIRLSWRFEVGRGQRLAGSTGPDRLGRIAVHERPDPWRSRHRRS
jgi:hydrogenase expression/formation protein HypE